MLNLITNAGGGFQGDGTVGKTIHELTNMVSYQLISLLVAISNGPYLFGNSISAKAFGKIFERVMIITTRPIPLPKIFC